MSSKTLLGMPDELLFAILDHLKKDPYGTGCWQFKMIDIKTLRASCRRLNRIVSPCLYQTLYLSCHQLDLDVFRLVSKNPLLIGGVRELVIDDTTFPTCINDWNTYKRAVTLWAYTQMDPDFDEDEDDLEEWEIQRRFDMSSSMVVTKSMWEHFNSGIKGHHENRLAHADIAALKEALPKMKSLCSLINDDVAYTRDYYNTRKSTIRAAYNVGRDPRILSRQARVLHVALHVLEDPDVGPRLQEFRVDASESTISGCSPGLPITLFGNQSPFPDRLLRAFSTTNMTELYLVLGNFDDGQKGRNIMDHGRVTQLLSSLPQLEQLHFEPHGMATSGALPQITFPRLHTVQFYCGEVDPDKLIGFLERQGSVLKILHISHCNIPTDLGQLWGDVADRINRLQRENVTNLQQGSFCENWVGENQARCLGFQHSDPDYRESEDCVDWCLDDGRLFEKHSFGD
ncbi:hypothetical protein NW752_011012 [Fusarium irregulare]|nr:hypothetical protein NW752_011012 [Fusarium irregulare]